MSKHPESTEELEVGEAERQQGEEKAPSFRFSRRSFLGHVGAASIAATASPAIAAVQGSQAGNEPAKAAGSHPVTLKVNGKQRKVQIEPRVSLLDCLREDMDLPGTKKGCDHGQCGACTVHVNGRRVLSCLTLASTLEGDEITTVEGLGQPGNLHPMQAAFVEHDAYQCGICTSGQIMSAVAVTKEPWGKSDADVQEAMAGNICRCGAYKNIVAAVQQVRKDGNRNVAQQQPRSTFVEEYLATSRAVSGVRGI